MNDFKITVLPGYLNGYRDGKPVPVHVGVEYKHGRLSISGVVGAKPNGDCWGSCGQCLDSVRDILSEEGVISKAWDEPMIQKLIEVWREWHLNDMRPYCAHQKALGWDRLAKEELTLYHWTITHQAYDAQRGTIKRAKQAIKAGETFTPTYVDVVLANLEHEITTEIDRLSADIAEYYKPEKDSIVVRKQHIETKIAGHVYWGGVEDTYCTKTNKHSKGLLCKPCPECGHEYGGKWQFEAVPDDVLDWLENLPKAEIQCAWGSV